MPYRSTKTYGHDVGLSCVFRQHGAKSHCNQLHGYALSVRLEFECEQGQRDANGWVVDFGGLKEVKQWLKDTFDHKLLVAENDPMKDEICALGGLGIADPIVVPGTGCEAFAAMVYIFVSTWMQKKGYVYARLAEVHVMEHGANSAIYIEDKK